MVDQCSPHLNFDVCVHKELIVANRGPPRYLEDNLTDYGIRKLHDSNVQIYKLEVKKIRSPKRYTFADKSDRSGKKILQHVITNETIHPSVRIRLLKADIAKTKGRKEWKPYALADFQLKKCDANDFQDANGAEWKWVKEEADRDGNVIDTLVIYEENIWKHGKQAHGIEFQVTREDNAASSTMIEDISCSEMMIPKGDMVLLMDEGRSLQITPVRPLGYWAWVVDTVGGLFHWGR
jgi:hypothetical protein